MAPKIKKTKTAAVKKTVKKEAEKPETKAKKAAPKAPKKAAKTKKADAKAKATQATTAAPSPEKQEIIVQFAVKSGDTGSPEVQIALLTQRIAKLVTHLKGNPHDNHSRRGLLGIVSKRRRLINYLEKKDATRVKEIKQKLGLT